MVDTTKTWVRVCSLDDIAKDKASEVIIAGQRLTLARCGDSASILQGFCSHMLFPLAGSAVDDCVLTCALHNSTFNTRDGSVIDWSTFPPLVGPALAAIRQRKALRTYETKVEGDEVFVLWPTDAPETVTVKMKR